MISSVSSGSPICGVASSSDSTSYGEEDSSYLISAVSSSSSESESKSVSDSDYKPSSESDSDSESKSSASSTTL